MDYDDLDRPRAAARPDSLKKLRACRTCHLIKTYEQFHSGFCENCPTDRPEGNSSGVRSDWVEQHTTDDFEGIVSMMQPGVSWVSRWLKMRFTDADGRVVPYLPGVYAILLPAEERKRREGAARRGAAEDDEYEDEEGDEEEEEEGEEEEAAASGGRGGKAGGRGAGAGGAGDRNDPSQRDAAIDGALVAQDEDD